MGDEKQIKKTINRLNPTKEQSRKIWRKILKIILKKEGE